MTEDFDLESLVHVEQTFYESGYQDGYDRGRIHGLIEGRALGREKGYEMWEELGFYEGFASTWKSFLLEHGTADDERTINNANRLLDLIAQFPRINPSSTDKSSEIDISQLLNRIRSRYKVLCASLGVRPTLRASRSDQTTDTDGMAVDDEKENGPKSRVWPVLSQLDPSVTNQDLSY
ncbi:hypothetical protein NP233_g652 [Leucocoprinus birnbaumii]|uniref:Essential protein Yae1 N-terminal domain-containing protein n=1 Tax=Leucocoprinus birnbaumii TaxID=56174 RepID=A0AAD5W1F4_9AGAR|nr:hypothetical protein NP233_g652 [Leucocoprinus birnbaumii]